MIIRRITLNNFLSHKNTTVEFPLGVTVFVGPNGAGKTSIIDGIFVALFNHRPRGENWSDIIHRGSTSARIELDFEEGGVPYHIVWERRKTGAPTYKLYRADSGTLIAEGVHEVQAQLEAITGLDRDSAINSILIRQGEITSLLDKTPADRKKIIGRLIGLDKLETAWRNMENVIRYFKDKIREYERLQAEYDFLVKQLEELELERKQVEAEIQELSQKIRTKEAELADATRSLRILEEKKERYTQVSNEIDRLTMQLEVAEANLQRTTEELTKALQASRKAEDLFPQVQKLEPLENLREIMRNILQQEEKKSALLKELARIEGIENTINKTISFHKEYLRTETEIKSLEKRIAELQTSRESLARLENEKENLLRDLDSLHHKLQETLEQLKEYPIFPEKVNESLLSKTPEELEKEITELKTKLGGNLSVLNGLREELEEIKNAKDKMEELEPIVARLPVLKELKALNSEIAEVKREIERVKDILSNIEELRRSLQELQPIHEEYQQVTEELEKLHEELDKIRGELERLNLFEAKLHEKEAQLRRIDEEVRKLENQILKLLPNPTPDAKEERLEELVKEINRMKEELKEHQNKIGALMSRINEIKEYFSLLEGSSICPVCHREMDEEHKARVKREFLEEIAQIESEIHSLRGLRDTLQKRLDELEALRRSIELLDVERYQKMKKELEELVTSVSELKEQISKRNELERKFIDLQREITKKEERKKNIERDYHRYSMVQEQLEKILRENPEAKLQKQLSQFEAQVSQLRDRVSQLTSTLGGAPQNIDAEISKLEDINAEYLSFKAKAEKLEQIKEQIARIEAENERISTIKIPSRLIARKMVLEQETKILKEKLEEVNNKIESTKKDVKQLEELRIKREELRSKLEELRPAHEKYLGNVEALKKERPKNEVLMDIENISKQLSELERKKAELIRAVEEVPEDIDGEISRLRNLKEEYIRASEEAKKVGSLQEQVSQHKAEVESLKRVIESKKRELVSLEFSEEELKSMQEKVHSIENEITRIEGEKVAKENNLMEKTNKAEEIRERIKTLEKELKRVEQLQKLVLDLEKIRAAYHKDGVQRLLRKKIAPIISELATQYIENFNMDITDIYLSEDFDVTVVKNSIEVPISTLSGGEKVTVALALRLAIAHALSRNLSIVIMDEPTTHLDEERRKDLVEILDRFFKSGEAIPQVVIVTHHPELEAVADTLYLVRNVDGVSQVQEVGSLQSGL